jgi:hypothetical protein
MTLCRLEYFNQRLGRCAFWNDSKYTSSKLFQNIGNNMFISLVPYTMGQKLP